METSLLTVLVIGLVLGIKHAIEPDHVIAVSTIVTKTKNLWASSLAGMFWGIGHTATLFIVGIPVIVMKKQITPGWAMTLEFAVGIMLVYLGISSMVFPDKKKIHSHQHKHDEINHTHFHSHNNTIAHQHQHQKLSFIRSIIIGSIHGLAGSGAMILLTMTTVKSIWQAGIYIVVFGVGTVIGMLLCTTIIAIPFVMSSKNAGINKSLTRLAGMVSTVFGVYYMYNLGINEGLFRLWIQ